MSKIDQIKDRLNIVDVVSLYVKLNKAGSNMKGISPFTSEKTASFFVSPDKGLFYCFSSGKGGDIFNFIQEIEGVDFSGALKILAEKAGVSLADQDFKEDKAKNINLQIMEETTRFFERGLASSTIAKEYLKDRGVTEETQKIFRVGFAENRFDGLINYLLGRGFAKQDLLSLGVAKEREDRSGIYDTFRNRIIFPIMDSAGRVIAFTGRLMPGDDKGPKYLNSPDTVLFKKSEVLFGLFQAKTSIRKYDFAILAEGQFDVLMLHQSGFRNAVASSGTAMTDKLETATSSVNHLGLLKRITEKVVLVFDADSAGERATLKNAGLLLAMQFQVKVVDLPEGKDPADLLFSEGKDSFGELLKKSSPLIEFLAERLVKPNQDPIKRAVIVREKILPEIAKVESQSLQEAYLKQISQLAGVSFESMLSDLKALPKEVASPKTVVENNFSARLMSLEEKVLGIIWSEESYKNVAIEALNDFLPNLWQENLNPKIEQKDESISLRSLAEIEVSPDPEKAIRSLVLMYATESLKERVKAISSELSSAGLPQETHLDKLVSHKELLSLLAKVEKERAN